MISIAFSNLMFIRSWEGARSVQAEFSRNWVYAVEFTSYKRSIEKHAVDSASVPYVRILDLYELLQ